MTKQEKFAKAFKQFKDMFEELIAFKNEEDFVFYGFGVGGPYNRWLVEVKELEESYYGRLLKSAGISVLKLKSLGTFYVISRGQSTVATSDLTAYIIAILEDEEAVSSNN